MILYALEDADSNQFELSGSSIGEPAKSGFAPGDDLFSYENKIVANSALDGSVKLGVTRINSREIVLSFNRALGETSPTYRVVENTLIEFLLRVEYLVDLTNSLKIKVALKNYNISYDSGSHKLSSSNNIVLELLEPFWSSTTATVDSDTLAIDLNNFNIVNNGYLKVYPVITFTTSVAVTLIKLFMESSNEGIIITDSIFGTSTYLTLIIDCLNGTIDMGGLDRSISIYPGTGYFSFPVGNSTLVILPSAVCDVSISYNKRYYI